MEKTFGSPIPAPALADGITIVLGDCAQKTAWQHVGVTADFLGSLFSAAAAKDGADGLAARHSIGYLVNELLENAFKFRLQNDTPVSIGARLEAGQFLLALQNAISDETAAGFEALLSELMASDPGDLLIEKIEQNAEGDSDSGSGLGILTLLNDYSVEMGWKFSETETKGVIELTTFSRLPLD